MPEYHYRDSTKLVHVRDSVFHRDNVFMYVRKATRSITSTTTRYTKGHYYSDTINNVYRDSIPVPYPVVKTVHKLHWWQKSLMWIGIAFLFSSIIWVFLKDDCRDNFRLNNRLQSP